ncbi:MAG: hypothetical protein O7D86_12030 [Proteobacteria bacterium]|nr:hypothetical protein [Pseudomonadota bacterium]
MANKVPGPWGKSMLAVAVELVSVPDRASLVAVTISPREGVYITVTVSPTGTSVAARLMVTGLVMSAGNTTSSSPLGTAGTVTPSTVLILRRGRPGRDTALGRA